MRIPTAVILAADLIRFVADTVQDLSQDACKETILGENGSLACIAVDVLAIVADAIDEGIHFCEDDLNSVVLDTSYEGLSDVHTDLYSIGTSLDTHLTTANTDIDAKIDALSNLVTTLIANLSNHVIATTNQEVAALQQIMKLQMTPDGLKSSFPRF
jgi:hypothetical protein